MGRPLSTLNTGSPAAEYKIGCLPPILPTMLLNSNSVADHVIQKVTPA
jgi:hypothetical protein